MNPYAFPDWLRPYKNEWRSAGSIARIMQIRDQPFAPWFADVKARLQSVQVLAQNGQVSTRYLVKQVWAAARAHGLTAVQTQHSTPAHERVAELEQQVETLRSSLNDRGLALHTLQGRVRELTGGEGESGFLNLRHKSVFALALRMTEAKPLPGVYFLLSEDNEVTYVGQSQNVLGRMSGHNEKVFQSVRMIYEPDRTERMRLESRMIWLLKPRDNSQGMKVPPIVSELSAEPA